MSDEKIDNVLQAFLESVTQVLRGHAESLSKLTGAVERIERNQGIEHLNVKEIGEQVNHHTAILGALDAEVKRRLGYTTEEPPSPVN
jgi:hypothetical protein